MKKNYKQYFIRLRRFMKNRFGISTTVLILSFFTGVFGATAAIIIKNLLHFTVSTLSNTFPEETYNYLYLAFPLIGIILTLFFVRKFVKDNISHGVSIVLKAIAKNNGKLRPHNMYSSMVASSITVGFGGSVGLEAPIVLTGSSIGSNLARFFNLNPKNTILLLACGSSAAMAAIFKAPVAAIVFAIEVLMLDLTTAAILPLLISAVTGTILSMFFLGENVMFSQTQTSAFQMSNIPFYLILGIFAGLASIYFLRVLRFIEKSAERIKQVYVRAIIGGLILGGLIFIFPVFYGEGYEHINTLLKGDTLSLFRNSPLYPLLNYHILFALFLICIIFVKVIATSVTTASGGNGGTFAPSLFVGAFAGFFIADILNYHFNLDLPYINFVLAGMAGVMAGVMHAPLTSIFLIAELSTGYSLLIPLMITSSISYLTVYPFEKHSVYTRKLAEKGDLRTHNKDKFAMRKIELMPLLDNNITTISVHSSLRDYTQCIANSKRNLFVVLDDDKRFAGLLVMDDHRDLIFKQELYDTVFVKDLMIQPDVFVYDTDTGAEVNEKFQKTKNFNMPVIDQDKKYIGFLSKATFLSAYKDLVASESED